MKRRKRRSNSYVEDEGPRSGFSLNGWKDNLPRNLPTHELEFFGQLLIYIVTEKTNTFATKNSGTSHGDQLLKARTSSERRSPTPDSIASAESTATGWTELSLFRLGLPLLSISEEGSFPIPPNSTISTKNKVFSRSRKSKSVESYNLQIKKRGSNWKDDKNWVKENWVECWENDKNQVKITCLGEGKKAENVMKRETKFNLQNQKWERERETER